MSVLMNLLNLLPQNRCFVRSFRQFSSHLTKCQACHGICTLSPLDAALTMRFAKNTQQDTSKVLRLPRKLQRIFLKRRKSLAPASQDGFPHVTKRAWMSRSATPCHAKRSNATLKMIPFAKLHRHGHTALARTVANGCERLRNVERTHPQPPDPQSETGTLVTHSGKNYTRKCSSSSKWICNIIWYNPTWWGLFHHGYSHQKTSTAPPSANMDPWVDQHLEFGVPTRIGELDLRGMLKCGNALFG